MLLTHKLLGTYNSVCQVNLSLDKRKLFSRISYVGSIAKATFVKYGINRIALSNNNDHPDFICGSRA